jgi:hypothetical protein
MGEVKSFTEEYADGVASLYFRAVRGQNRPLARACLNILLSFISLIRGYHGTYLH